MCALLANSGLAFGYVPVAYLLRVPALARIAVCALAVLENLGYDDFLVPFVLSGGVIRAHGTPVAGYKAGTIPFPYRSLGTYVKKIPSSSGSYKGRWAELRVLHLPGGSQVLGLGGGNSGLLHSACRTGEKGLSFLPNEMTAFTWDIRMHAPRLADSVDIYVSSGSYINNYLLRYVKTRRKAMKRGGRHIWHDIYIDLGSRYPVFWLVDGNCVCVSCAVLCKL